MTYLDTRELYSEMLELQERRDAEHPDDTVLGPLDESEAERLAALEALFDEIGEDAGRYGETLVPESDFEDYAQELADDLGCMSPAGGLSWPLTCIDWTQAARELAYDYSSVTFDGTEYLYRA